MPFQHAIAGGNGNLVITSFQSPNFVHDVSGWQVAKDGSAEFNNLTIRGTFFGTDFVVSSLGLFFYSSTPALGNLIASVTPAAGSNDGEGNAFQAGFTVYDGTAFVQMHINSLLGAALEQVTGVASEAAHGAFYQGVLNKGLANETITSEWLGPGSTHVGAQALVQLVSAAADGSTLAGGTIYDLLSGVATNFAHWNYQGFSIDAGSVTAAEPGTGTSDANPATPESWHTLSLTTATASGNGVNGMRYKILATNTLLLEWDINTNAGNNVTIATLPAGWRPAKAHNIGSGSYGGSTTLTSAQNPHLIVNTNGTIVMSGTNAAAYSMCGTSLIGMD